MSGFENLLRHVPSLPNTRLPPIVAHASQRDNSENSSSIRRNSFTPAPCRIATISRHKLNQEAAAKDPDLRRCIGHHRVFHRSVQEAQAEIQKYMASMRGVDENDPYNYDYDDSDSDSSDDEADFELITPKRIRWRQQPQQQYQPSFQTKSLVISQERECSTSPALARSSTRVEVSANPASASPHSSSSTMIRDQIANVVRTMIRRRLPPQNNDSSCAGGIVTTTTMTMTSSTPSTSRSSSYKEGTSSSPLRRISANNPSTPNFSLCRQQSNPEYKRRREPELERGRSDSPSQSWSRSRSPSSSARSTRSTASSITSRGRRYVVSRLGFRRRWPPSGPLQASVASC